MKKIPTLYIRDFENNPRLVTEEVTPGCEWVISGEGKATTKLDGTACLVKDGKLYKRYDAKKGRIAPEGFIPAQDEPDEKTGHWPGWLLVGDGPEDKWHREAFARRLQPQAWEDGTYELCGPKIQGDPEGYADHFLILHATQQIMEDVPRSRPELISWLNNEDIEGIVFWRDIDDPNCDKAKIKKSDFGLKRK